jgi:hypothetical protein
MIVRFYTSSGNSMTELVSTLVLLILLNLFKYVHNSYIENKASR